MITAADLKSHTKADLCKMAKRLGIAGCSGMRKDELVSAIAKSSKSKLNGSAARPAAGRATATKSSSAKKSGAAKKSASAKKSGTTKKSTAGGAAKPRTATAKRTSRSKATVVANQTTEVNGTAAVAPSRGTTNKKRTAPSKTAAAKTSGTAKGTAKQASSKKKVVAKTASSPSTLDNGKSGVPKKVVAKKATAKAKPPKKTNTSPKVLKKIRELQLQRESGKDIAFRPTLVRPPGAAEPIWEKEPLKDRIGLFVRDPYWMQASWDITRGAVDRARAAMAEQWHSAKPVLRLLRLDDGGTSNASETVERDIEIHGGIRNFYIPWTGEATSFRVLVGYLSSGGRFHAIAKSNIVKTPAAGTSEAIDEHWGDVGAESERIFALSGGYDAERETGELKEMLEERLHRSLGAPALAKLGAGADGPFRRRGDFHFDMDIELVVYGSTVSDGYLTLNGEPVTLRPDGTFAVRLPFPDRRQVLPAVACTRDGSQQRTIVVAVERNTKIMEPLEQERDTGE